MRSERLSSLDKVIELIGFLTPLSTVSCCSPIPDGTHQDHVSFLTNLSYHIFIIFWGLLTAQGFSNQTLTDPVNVKLFLLNP